MTKQRFFYVSYIKTTPEELWTALTSTEFTEQYWMGHSVESDWKIGSQLKFKKSNGEAVLVGKVLASEKPKVLSYTWSQQLDEEMRAEKPSRITFQLERFEPNPALVKLTVTHDEFPENSKVFSSISTGWPMVLSSLKSLLETDHALAFEGTCGK